MKKKEIKGYFILALTLGTLFSACSSKTPVTNPTPMQTSPIESLDPNISIPGIDDPAATTTDPAVTDPAVTDPAVTTTDPAATTTATPTTSAVPTSPTPTPVVSVTPTPTPVPTPTPTPVPVTCNMTVQGDYNIAVGKVRELTSKIECSDSSTKTDEITWTSSDTSIATIDATGKVTGVKAGTTSVTVASKVDSNLKATVSFKVNASCSLTISGNLTNVKSLGIGSSDQLTGKVDCSDGSSSTNLSWTTTDFGVASVSSTGLVTGKKLGKTTISASYVIDPTLISSLDITVNDPLGNDYRGLLAENKVYQPRGIDARNGQLYVADYDKGGTCIAGVGDCPEGQFKILDFSGNLVKTIQGAVLDSLPKDLTGIATDGGRIWVLNRIPYAQSLNNLYSFDSSGGSRLNAKMGTTSTDFVDMAIDPSTRALYIASRGINNVIKVNYDTNGAMRLDTQQFYFAGTTPITPAGIGTDDLGNVFVTNSGANPPTIIKYGKDGTKALEFSSTGKNTTGPIASKIGDIAYDPLNGGIIYVLAQVSGANVILRYDNNGNFVRKFGESAVMSDPRAIAIGADGTIYVTDYAKNAIHQFAPGR